MEVKKLKEIRLRLTRERENLIESINRKRIAAEAITVESTEDEGDLASISHDRELLYNLHESDFTRLRFIQAALKSMDHGQYGECLRCNEDISEKRLDAVPWATMCVKCQEEAEMESASSGMVMAGQEIDEPQL
jgi:DnaK suppressor protein